MKFLKCLSYYNKYMILHQKYKQFSRNTTEYVYSKLKNYYFYYKLRFFD